MSNPRRAKALRALGAAKRANRARILSGKAPVIAGEKVSHSGFKRATGISVAQIKKGGKPEKSERKARSTIVAKWGKKAV